MIRKLRELLELSGPSDGRLLPMEGVRGIAVVLVFLQHFFVQYALLVDVSGVALVAVHGLRIIGNFGVAIFFVLSGYLIYGGLVRRHQHFVPFMKRRIVRIYPAFLSVFVVVVAMHLLTGSGRIPRDPVDGGLVVLANLLLLPGVFAAEALLSPAWTLSYEMAFYLSFGLLVPGLRMADWPRRARVAFMVVLMAVVIVLGAVFKGGWGWLASPMPLVPFLAGVLLQEAGDRRLPFGLVALAPVVTVVHILFPVAFPYFWLVRGLVETLALTLICGAAFQGGNPVARMFAWTPLRWLGNMSYSFYLVHALVVLAVFRLLAWQGGFGWPAVPVLLLLVPVFIASTAASFVLFVLVERPISLKPRGRAKLAPASA